MHRLYRKPSPTKPIIVRFTSYGLLQYVEMSEPHTEWARIKYNRVRCVVLYENHTLSLCMYVIRARNSPRKLNWMLSPLSVIFPSLKISFISCCLHKILAVVVICLEHKCMNWIHYQSRWGFGKLHCFDYRVSARFVSPVGVECLIYVSLYSVLCDLVGSPLQPQEKYVSVNYVVFIITWQLANAMV